MFPGMPVGVDDLLGPVVDAGGLHLFGSLAVARGKELDDLLKGGVFLAGGDIVANGSQALLDGAGGMIAAAGGLPFGFEILEELVEQPQDAAGVEGGFEGLGKGLAGDVFEKLVDAVAPLEHRVVVLFGSDQMRERELLGREIELKGMGEGDLEGVITSAGSSFEEEFALLADDEELGGFSGAAGEFDDGFNGADVEIGKNDGRIPRPRTARACRRARGGRRRSPRPGFGSVRIASRRGSLS